jgi:hypothetical protein
VTRPALVFKSVNAFKHFQSGYSLKLFEAYGNASADESVPRERWVRIA